MSNPELPEPNLDYMSVPPKVPKPIKGFKLEGAMLPDSPFGQAPDSPTRTHIVDTGKRNTVDAEKVKEALHNISFLREDT